MRPNKKQQGVSLIVVVFILVSLSILASALVQVLTASNDSVAREVLSARAFLAAESGAQRMLNEIYEGNESDCDTPSPQYLFPALEGCATVAVVCTLIDDVPVGSPNIYYTITSTGQCGPIGERASRTVEVQAKNI